MKTKLLCLAAPLAGIVAMLMAGSEPPPWLLRLEVMVFSIAALGFGFTMFAPVAPDWAFSRPVKGVVCLWLGIGAMFVPTNLLVSAVFLGVGTRLVMGEFRPATVLLRPAVAIRRKPGDIAVREAGAVVPRD